jgi:F-type H+-transporting ATPase subunit alpha
MKLRADEITAVLTEQLAKYNIPDGTESQTGTVLSLGDGIARVYGLERCMSNELLRFENGTLGMAVNLEEDNIGCVLLGGESGLREGSAVTRTIETVSIPVGEAMLGRVVDPLGQPVDGGGEIATSVRRPIEFPAPSVNDRKSVTVPMQTGVLAVDSMVPIGRGQRELIIGDRQTGKTSLAIDAIINQKGQNMVCVYVAIGQKNSSVAAIVHTLKRCGAMDYTVVVNSPASDPASRLFIAPYAGCAIAEYFMYSGRDALIVYDDLSKHAAAYRTMSLLLRRPPGREAYPGDVFYLHSRLLERAARLSEELGGGSITALPIVETQAGDFSAYVPTNVVSITDGQIYLQTDLFLAGVRPAVNVGISVSRVGGAAQTKAMKKVAGSLRINLAQYRDMEVFAQFGADLDKATRDKLAQGERLIETLKQPVSQPMDLARQVITLFTATGGAVMDIPVNEIRRFNEGFYDYVRENSPHVIKNINDTGMLSKDDENNLSAAEHVFTDAFGGR